MTARLIDAGGSKLTDALFAAAYRAVVPILADAKHTSVRACPARLAELSKVTQDISDVVEVGTAKDGKVRAIAVPVTVHVDDGIAVIQDDAFDKHTVSFEINGLAELQIVNLEISATEAAAEKAAAAAAAAEAAKNADADLQKKIAAAKEQGKEEALIEQAKQEGAASAQKPVQTLQPQPPQPPPAPTGKVQ